jgi:hypothetical protein
MADEGGPVVAAPRGRKLLRLFLMVSGGLAAPALALAAFFLSNSGGSATPIRAGVQAGQVTGTAAPRRASPSVGAAPAATPTTTTTTTTTAPAVPAGPLRDPFVPLVTQAPPGGTPAR